MAGTMRIEWRRAAFRELRTHEAVQRDIAERAQRVAEAAGEGFEARTTENPRNRARAAVVAVTARAEVIAARDNVLIRALDAGRD